MSHVIIKKHSKNELSGEEEEKILNELKKELEHHDIFSFKLGNKSLNSILSSTKSFDKKFFHYQRYNFKLQDLSPDICTFYDITLQNKKDNNININNDLKEENLIDEDGKRKKINDILSGNNVKISEVLENIMEDVNIFDKIYQEEQEKIENEDINIEVEQNTSKNELKYILFQQLKENEKSKINKPKDKSLNQNRIYPIEMVNKIEKDYNNILVEKIKSETKNTDLYPLDTYKKNNDLEIQLISEHSKDLQFQSLKEKMLIKEKTNLVEEKDVFSTFIVDKPNEEPGSIEQIFMYVGTSKGKVVKILLNNRKNQFDKESIREEFDSKEDGINCIDIFENSMVTGHQNGSIVFWEENKIFFKTKNAYQNQKNIEIICLKIIKIFPKKKYEIIYSDKLCKVYFIKRIKGLLKDTETKELLVNDNKFPIYKISFISAQNDLKKAKKKLMLFALTSPKGINIIKLRPLIENKEEKEEQNQYSSKFITFPPENLESGGIFDSSFGFGFPPMEEKSQKNSIRGSISDSIVIGKDELENLLFAISYSEIINLYDVKISRSNKIYLNPIGHFINDKPIINISFLTNSYIAIITNDFFLKIINTFDFDKKQYTKNHEPTKNSLLVYEPIELKKLFMMRQTNIFKYNEAEKKFNNYYIYLNSIATLNKSIIILGRQNLYQYTLLQWEYIIQSLDKDKEYEKMLWLSMVVFNNNKNLLTIQSKNKNQDFLKSNKEQICSAIISKFLFQVVMVEIEKYNNFYPIRMLIEFCIGAEFYDWLYEAILPLSQKGYDRYLYQNLTKYILNDDCKDIDFKPIFLFNYIKYYVEMREKNILSEALFHINIFTLLEQKLILTALEEYKLINPAIYTQIKNMKKGEIDYFKPIKYLYDFFHKDYCKEKQNKLFETESDKVVKEEYYKLMTQNDINYYSEEISTYYEYLGHKILWYCNKCLSGEEFHTNVKISNKHFEKVSKKIIVFLTLEEVMKEFLEFDSYSYFQVINRFFIESKLFNLIHREDSTQDLFKDINNFIEQYLGEKKIPSHVLSDKYFFYEIQGAAESLENIYIKLDYYKMISLICKQNKELHLDKASIKNAIKFFINYFHELKKSNFDDKFNCHKKPDDLYDYEKQKEEIESNILIMIKSFEFHNELIIDDIVEILKLNNIYLFPKASIYLYEAANRYEESFELHKKELEEEDSDIPKNERIKLFFEWINGILEKTSKKDQNKKEEYEIIHQKFKDFLLSNFNYLSNISLSELSDLVDKWFKGQEEKIISKLNDSKSLSLQFKYINYYLANHEYDPEQNEENNTYYKFLLIKINLLIKENNKEQVLNVLHHNHFLCKINLLNDLLKKKVYDSCIFIYHILGKLDEGIELAKREIKETLEEIMKEITSKNYNSINIDNKLNKYKKYVELGLGICQKSEITRKREIDLVDDYWLLLINTIYTFQIKFKPEFNKNKNNYKTADYIKINNILNETFESAIAKMTDCISLPLILDVMGEKCGEAGFSKFKQLNYMMFSNFRLSENIFNLKKSLIESGISLEVDNYLYERNKGHFAIINTCGICKEFLGKGNVDKIKYFNCNHVYHYLCFLKEGGGNECFICKKNDCIINKDEKKYFEVLDKIKYKENLEKIKKKEIELNKEILRREKMNKLKKLNKKHREIHKVFNEDFLYES